MSKNFKADLSAVADEVPNHLDLDAGALTQRVARGQRRRKVTSGALTVLLVAGIGVGGYAVLDTLNHDSGPAAPLTSEPQILLDRPGVGDYNPVCGATWDPAATIDDDVFVERGVRITLGNTGVIVPQPGRSPVKMTATSLTDIELTADQDLSIRFAEGSYAYLTKDSAVVAMGAQNRGALNPGTRLPYEQKHPEEPESLGAWLSLDLIDCRIIGGETIGLELPDEAFLPAGEYQLYGYVAADLFRGDELLGSGSLWAGPTQIDIPEQPYWPLSDP